MVGTLSAAAATADADDLLQHHMEEVRLTYETLTRSKKLPSVVDPTRVKWTIALALAALHVPGEFIETGVYHGDVDHNDASARSRRLAQASFRVRLISGPPEVLRAGQCADDGGHFMHQQHGCKTSSECESTSQGDLLEAEIWASWKVAKLT